MWRGGFRRDVAADCSSLVKPAPSANPAGTVDAAVPTRCRYFVWIRHGEPTATPTGRLGATTTNAQRQQHRAIRKTREFSERRCGTITHSVAAWTHVPTSCDQDIR